MAKAKKVAKKVAKKETAPLSPAKKAAPASALVGGYHALALPLAPGALFRRFLYVKAHVAKSHEGGGEAMLAPERSAYVVNVPSAVADVETWLRARLEPAAGAVQHVVVAAAPADGADPLLARSAHVAFKSADALKKLLALQELAEPEEVEAEEAEEDAAVSGLQKYLRQYRANKPGLATVKAIADQYMAKFDAEEDEDFRRREELKAQVDDDGFKTVVNTKKRSLAAAEDLARPAKKQKSKEMTDFYRFQMRERKRDQLKSLRERFEEDRQMVEKLKRSNKFKPE
ncbi:hypothetical protein PybrP1_003885 [[Pythium] brassicae (nom. inval.)]|nr:hypothetical protein PybrP1_003885 [[Pythium] brassicae (nom. inval.)]